MNFSSVQFLLIFMPVFFGIYWLVPRQCKNMVLLLGSVFFYAKADWKHLVLLLVSVLINYFFGRLLICHKHNRKLLFPAIAFNIAYLFWFKTMTDVLPLGISFYTFQAIAYLIDVWQDENAGEKSLLRFATFMTMFPKLLSGPLVKYREIKGALKERKVTVENVAGGLKLLTIGLASKVFLADRIGLLWHEIQVTGFESVSIPLAWLGAIAYSMEIYFDFWGYSLMAVGLGRMLGFCLPYNFHNPYMATGVRDFYRRWHITLGKWFQEYVYIPLGGNRKGSLCTIRNLLIVWLLTSFWHGCTLNFFYWGMLLSLFIIIEKMIAQTGTTVSHGKLLSKCLSHIYVLAVIPVTWICFAITDVEQLQIYMGRMFGLTRGIQVSGGDWWLALNDYGVLFLVGAVAITSLPEKLYHRWKDSFAGSLILATLFWLCVWWIQREGQNTFLYFHF